MAHYEEFLIDQGADVAIQLELVEPTGAAKDLTGKTVTGSIKRTYNTPDSDAISFTSVVTDDVNGYVTLSLTNVQTSLMTAKKYLYDVEVSYQDSDLNTIIERVLEGVIQINPSVIR